MKLVELKGITKSINGSQILHDINLEINEGDFIALMGPSGCGKTTTLNIVGGMDKATSGEYLFKGADVTSFSGNELAKFRSESIGFIFQSFNLLRRYTVYENVKIGLEYATNRKQDYESKIDQLLQLVGLAEKKNSFITELSGGQMQRVAIARALVKNPTLILADEPTGNLDSKSAEQVMEILRQLHKVGATILLITHDEGIAQEADTIIRMKDGVIV